MRFSKTVTSKLIERTFYWIFSHLYNGNWLLFQHRSGSSDLRSQTPSPHFGPLTMNVPKNVNDRDIYRSNTAHAEGVNQSLTNRNMINMELTSARVPSPHQVWFLRQQFFFHFKTSFFCDWIFYRMFEDQVRCIIFSKMPWTITATEDHYPHLDCLEHHFITTVALDRRWIFHFSHWIHNGDGQRQRRIHYRVNRVWWMRKICVVGQCLGSQNRIEIPLHGIKQESHHEWPCHPTQVGMPFTRRRVVIEAKQLHQVWWNDSPKFISMPNKTKQYQPSTFNCSGV